MLSLFFIDRVANYRDYDAAGQPVKGKFAEAFEAALAALAREEHYQELDWLGLPVDQLHNGYFAQDRKGVFKDTHGDTQVTTTAISVAEEQVPYGSRPVPDVLAYLPNETELTRSTLVHILTESGRLTEFYVDPRGYQALRQTPERVRDRHTGRQVQPGLGHLEAA